MNFKNKYFHSLLNIIAMFLVIISRSEFDWLAVAALVLILLSIGSVLNVYRNSK